MYRKKKMTDREHLSLQYFAAKNYNGAVNITDTKVTLLKEGFWFEFSIQPTPLSREYRVLIVYVKGFMPSTYILGPDIVEIADNKDIPHLYSQSKQKLCLTFPSYYEWKRGMSIPDTYIPWISMWLYYYEEWLLSGEWKGGGRHPGDEIEYGEDLPNSIEEVSRRAKQRKIDALEAIKKEKATKKINKVFEKRKEVFLSTEEGEAA